MSKSVRCDEFVTRDGSISIVAPVGNGHGVHVNRYPVRYSEVVDLPENIVFRTNRCMVSSAYCRLVEKKDELERQGVSFDDVMMRIENGALYKKRNGLCHSNLATKDAIETYLKYVHNPNFIDIKIYSFDEYFAFQDEKAKKSVSSDDEMDLYLEILSLEDISKGADLFRRIQSLSNPDFVSKALVLLKCKVYDIEDKHYRETKKHDKGELELLKAYK